MVKITSGLLPASAPIFREGISRSHPLLEKKMRLLQEAYATTTETDTPETEDAAAKRRPRQTQK